MRHALAGVLAVGCHEPLGKSPEKRLVDGVHEVCIEDRREGRIAFHKGVARVQCVKAARIFAKLRPEIKVLVLKRVHELVKQHRPIGRARPLVDHEESLL